MSTEANKIMEGYGDWMFYGHVREGAIIRWMVLSLSAFRSSFESTHSYKGIAKTNSNDGGATTFVAFDVRKMPDVLIGCSWDAGDRKPAEPPTPVSELTAKDINWG